MKKKRLLFISILITLTYLALFKMEFSCDTYSTHDSTIGGSVEWMLKNNGRILIGIIYWLFGLVSTNTVLFYYISFFAALIFSILSVYLLSNILDNYVNEKYSVLLSFGILLNPYFIEYMLFIEKGCFMMTIFFCVVALLFFRKFLLSHKIWKKILNAFISFVFVLLSAISYQIIPAMFVVLAVLITILESKKLLGFFVNNVLIAAIYGIAELIEFVFVKTVSTSPRIAGGGY